MKPASPALRAWVQQELDAYADDGHPGNWPRRVGHRAGRLLIHGDGVRFWYLSVDGDLYEMDVDDVGNRMHQVEDAGVYQRVVREAAQQHPQLTELLDPA